VDHPVAVAFDTIDVAPVAQVCLDLIDAAALRAEIHRLAVLVQLLANASGPVIGRLLLISRDDGQRTETCRDIGEDVAYLS
jgi:hypothetical protein